ncbi:MAG: hypothetical protein ACOX5F_11250 [Anaerovoracaceae bacterium]
MSDLRYNFQTLTPTSDVDLKIYLDALDFAMETGTVKNIAISGPYGAGKSSLIETYKEKQKKDQNKEATFLHISLAHFSRTDISDTDSKKPPTIEPDSISDNFDPDAKNLTYESDSITGNMIEGKIINQLIHQINSAKIPQTDFKIKASIPTDVCRNRCIASAVTIIAILHMILFETWTDLVNSLTLPCLKIILFWTTHYDSLLISGAVCLAALRYGIYYMVKTQRFKKTLKKISFQGNDIEIFSDEKSSYFDKHLNETLYLFENCGASNIVFEDMDRYNSNHIFEKLREMNTLINNRRKSDEPPLRFFYLLRDDIFVNKDRTKFFDYIIPVVPVIDGSNSLNKFLRVFEDAGIENEFSEEFLGDLSLYIDDMRILKNICNEYVIYYDQISIIKPNKDKLLAIIVYKNLFPRDFSNLQLRQGYVYTLLNNALTLSEIEIEGVKKEIDEIDDLLLAVKEEKLESVNELDALFLLPANLRITSINGTAPPEMPRPELARFVREHGSSNFKVADKLESLQKDPLYMKRKQAIEIKESNKTAELKLKRQSLKRQLLVLQGRRLKDIIPLVGEEKAFNIIYSNRYVKGSENTFKEIKVSSYFPLIVYLVRNVFMVI